MNLYELLPKFQRYMRFERDTGTKYIRSVCSSLYKLCEFADTTNIHDLTSNIIQEYLYNGRETQLWSVRTFRHHRQYCSSFFQWCVSSGYMSENPVLVIQKPKLPTAIPRSLTREEIQKVLASTSLRHWRYHFERTRNEAIIRTFIYTGLRLSELLNLKHEHVNLKEYSLYIKEGKGKKDRIIPIHSELAFILRRYEIEKKRMPYVSQWFFSSISSGKQLLAKDVYRVCQKVSEHSRIYFRPHMLRHSFARLAVESDMNIFKLKQILGHSKISTTQIYLSSSSESLRESLQKVEFEIIETPSSRMAA